jgi:hypothetical protein
MRSIYFIVLLLLIFFVDVNIHLLVTKPVHAGAEYIGYIDGTGVQLSGVMLLWINFGEM